jgi:DNA repair exonuclease SbcCD nuclease subunit
LKLAIICDTHFGIRGDSQVFFSHQKKFFETIFFPKLKEENITTLLHLGDLFDRRKYINFLTLQQSKSWFLDPLKEAGVQMHIVVGNHDVFYKNTNDINSLKLLLAEYDNIQVIEKEPVELTFDSLVVMLCPWITTDNIDLCLEKIKHTRAPYLMGHFEFLGFEMMRGQLSTHGFDRAEFKKFEQIFSGHFHHPSSSDNISYLGAPYEMTWSDSEGRRGFHILDTETLDLEFVSNPYRMFNKIEYNDLNISAEELENIDLTFLANSYVKVVTTSATNGYLLDVFLDKLQEMNPVDVKVIVDTPVDLIATSESFSEAQDTPTLLNAYVDSLSTEYKSELNSLLLSLYQEAQSIT